MSTVSMVKYTPPQFVLLFINKTMTLSRQKVIAISFLSENKKTLIHVYPELTHQETLQREDAGTISVCKQTTFEVFRCTNSNHLNQAKRHCVVFAIYLKGDVTHGVLCLTKELPLWPSKLATSPNTTCATVYINLKAKRDKMCST